MNDWDKYFNEQIFNILIISFINKKTFLATEKVLIEIYSIKNDSLYTKF